jgi:hypothetical protein
MDLRTYSAHFAKIAGQITQEWKAVAPRLRGVVPTKSGLTTKQSPAYEKQNADNRDACTNLPSAGLPLEVRCRPGIASSLRSSQIRATAARQLPVSYSPSCSLSFPT